VVHKHGVVAVLAGAAQDVVHVAPLLGAWLLQRNAPRGTVTYSVGVRASKAAKGRGADPFYWRFLEAGWTPRGRGQALKGGRNRKSLERSRARAGGRFVQYPFLEPAFKRSSSTALAAFERRFEADLSALNATP
jgi:hypothetical protein